MKTFVTLTAGIFLAAFLVFSKAPVSWADGHSPAEIQMLKDAAAALKATNPDLSEKLSKFAEKEAKETDEDDEENEKI